MNSSADVALPTALVEAKSWPFEEARRLIARLEKLKGGAEKTVIFETGYGPSGLPHIGTFGEVARTSMVRHAFETLTKGKWQTRLICFSDDMDGLRKVPTNVPNQAMLHAALDKPLTTVPDPFGKFESFAHHNNAMLRDFLDRFGFAYEFMSATEAYKAGQFDETLLRMLKAYDKVMDIILPTLGPERRATYSPFLPVSPHSGRVLQVPMIERHPKKGTIVYIDPYTGEKEETPVTGGRVKCQWKADWALRWTALGVDYEMAGKDLIESVTLSSKICRALGGIPPEGFNYELFLDDKGEKISKSKGNGLTIDEWLRYASPESLSLFMFQKPKSAKRLYFDVIPRAVDEYLQLLAAYPRQDAKDQAGQCGVARQPARRRQGAARYVRLAAQSCGRVQRARQGRAVGLHPAACAGREPPDASAARSPRRLCGALLRGLRGAAEEVPPARRGRGGRVAGSLGCARQGAAQRQGR
jgi:lysyl-tRNA synthetase class 1